MFNFAKKMNRNALVIICAAVIFVLGMLIGMAVGQSGAEKENEKDIDHTSELTNENEKTVADVFEEDKKRLGANASVELETQFCCGHSLIYEAEGDYSRKTQAELEARFKGYSLDEKSFSDSYAKLVRAKTVHCPSHYVLKEETGILKIYKTNEMTHEAEELMTLTLQIKATEELKKGIAFDSLKQINEYIENLDS